MDFRTEARVLLGQTDPHEVRQFMRKYYSVAFRGKLMSQLRGHLAPYIYLIEPDTLEIILEEWHQEDFCNLLACVADCAPYWMIYRLVEVAVQYDRTTSRVEYYRQAIRRAADNSDVRVYRLISYVSLNSHLFVEWNRMCQVGQDLAELARTPHSYLACLPRDIVRSYLQPYLTYFYLQLRPQI